MVLDNYVKYSKAQDLLIKLTLSRSPLHLQRQSLSFLCLPLLGLIWHSFTNSFMSCSELFFAKHPCFQIASWMKQLKSCSHTTSPYTCGPYAGFYESMFSGNLHTELFCQMVYENTFRFPEKVLMKLKPQKVASLVKLRCAKRSLNQGLSPKKIFVVVIGYVKVWPKYKGQNLVGQ
jgi:hypothetical protein